MHLHISTEPLRAGEWEKGGQLVHRASVTLTKASETEPAGHEEQTNCSTSIFLLVRFLRMPSVSE
eukprot:764607-Hanusia_phi.AAC.2